MGYHEYERPMSVEDKEVFRRILDGKQSGVMFHTKAMESFLMAGLCGLSMLQQYQAIDEYYQYLCLLEEYVKRCGEVPVVQYREPDPISIDAKLPMCEKIGQAIEVYKDYEKMTLDELKRNKKAMSEDDGIVSDLISGTKEELEFIHKMDKYIDACSYDEATLKKFDKWIYSTYKKKMPKLG